ncbi:MAG: cytochrome P450 [Planctomycetaceae bacterium]|nr:cytochrome P450 [Planctomycetaceae bacterium]
MSHSHTATNGRAAGPQGLPIFGNLLSYLPRKLQYLQECADRYGKVVRLRLGEPTWLLNNAEDVHHVLIANSSNYQKTRRLTGQKGRQLSGNGLLTSSSSQHLKQRRLLQPHFTKQTSATFCGLVQEETRRLAKSWHQQKQADVCREMECLAKSVILRVIFGDDFNDDDGEISAAIDARRRYIEHFNLSLFPFRDKLPTRVVRDYQHAERRLHETIDRELRSQSRSTEPPKCMLARFSSATYQNGLSMTQDQVRDEVLTLMSTGYETIGDGLTWCWYLLSQHQSEESRMVEEVKSVCQRDDPGLDHLDDLKFTRMVFNESLRLYPPTWIYVRMADNEDVLPSGTRVCAGDKIYICQYILHRNPQYFPDPQQFEPENFNDAAIANRPKFAFFPFGGGPRVCIGEPLARMEAILVLASLGRQFKLRCVDANAVRLHPGITLRPKGGLLMTIESRSH